MLCVCALAASLNGPSLGEILGEILWSVGSLAWSRHNGYPRSLGPFAVLARWLLLYICEWSNFTAGLPRVPRSWSPRAQVPPTHLQSHAGPRSPSCAATFRRVRLMRPAAFSVLSPKTALSQDTERRGGSFSDFPLLRCLLYALQQTLLCHHH